MGKGTYYMLDIADDKKTCRLVLLVDVPDDTNRASVKNREALVEYLGGAANITSKVAGADETALKAGSKYQYDERFRFSSKHLTDKEREDEVAARATAILRDLLSESDEVLQPVLDKLVSWRKSDTITV